jgi:hypothetical protein
LILVDERSFGKSAKPEALEQGNPMATQAGRIARPTQRQFRVLTLEGPAGETSWTRSARLGQRPYDMVSDMELGDIGTYLSDDSRHLVPQDSRCGNDIVSREQ